MIYDHNKKEIYFDNNDKVRPNIKAPKTKKIVTPNTKIRKKMSFLNENNDLAADYTIEFIKDKGKHVTKRVLTQSDFFKMVKKGVSYSVATAIVVVLLFGSVSAFDLHLGSEVIVNGKSVALIQDTTEFQRIFKDVDELIKATSKNPEAYEFNISYVPRLVSSKEVTSEFKIRQELLANCSAMIEAHAIYVNGNLIGGTLKEEDVFSALDQIKRQYADPSKDMTLSFDNDVSIRKEFIPLTQIFSKEGIMAIVTGSQQFNEIYSAYEEDTLWSVAEAYGMTDETIEELNPGVGEVLYEGQRINVIRKQALVKVKSEFTEEYNEQIPYETTKTEDNNLEKGKKSVSVAGVEGNKNVVAKVTMVNGIEVARDIISEKVTREPQNETIKVGTNASIKSAATEETTAKSSGKSTGTFLRPNYGVISSRFGPRSRGNHTGLDLAGSYGSNILAADGGVVTCAGWQGSYGKLVKIDHGNGFVTYYAHTSSILVKVGQRVEKGQVVAKVGSTGNSTGPHLHFEVRKNGVPQNPLSYIK